MTETDIKFEREDRQGVVATGSYLVDAFKRLGVRLDGQCEPEKGVHFCKVGITSGGELLSLRTRLENEYFEKNEGDAADRLACQAKIERPGEVVIMTEEKKEETKTEAEKGEDYVKQFADLPLEKKLANLVQLEVMALGETLSFVMNSPFKVFDKAMDVMAEFGINLDRKAKEATRPEEHRTEEPAEKKRKTTAKRSAKATDKNAS